MLYTHWKERKLCRSVLKDFALGEDPELFFKQCPGGEFTDDYGLYCTVEGWPSILYSSGYGAGTWTSLKRSLRRSTSSRLKMARTGTPGIAKGRLVPSESRVRSDGNGRCSLRLSGRGDELAHSSGVEPGETVESPGRFLRFCSVFLKSGNRHLIPGRSHSKEDERNPPVVPIRGCLEKIRRLLKGDEYAGRGSSQCGLDRRRLCNSHKVSVFGRKLAIQKFTKKNRTNPTPTSIW